MTPALKNLIDETARKIVADTEDCLLAETARKRVATQLTAFAGLVIAETTPVVEPPANTPAQ